MSEVPGLPVPGYKPTQSQERVDQVAEFKREEERLLRKLDRMRQDPGIDQRWLAIGRTQLEQAFMFINRSVFAPGRVELPEDVDHSKAGSGSDRDEDAGR